MARRENFYLDTRGGAYILQKTTRGVTQNAAMKIVAAATQMSGAATGHKANLKVVSSVEGIGGKPDARRITQTIVAMDSETEAQLRNGGYIQKAIGAGKV